MPDNTNEHLDSILGEFTKSKLKLKIRNFETINHVCIFHLKYEINLIYFFITIKFGSKSVYDFSSRL